MGRMNVAFEDEDLANLVRLVPPRRRSAFIVAAVREKLARERQRDAARATAGAWADSGRGDPAEDIRAQRDGWNRRGRRGGEVDG